MSKLILRSGKQQEFHMIFFCCCVLSSHMFTNYFTTVTTRTHFAYITIHDKRTAYQFMTGARESNLSTNTCLCDMHSVT